MADSFLSALLHIQEYHAYSTDIQSNPFQTACRNSLWHTLCIRYFQPWEESQILCLMDIFKQMDMLAEAGVVLPDYLCVAAFLWPFIAKRLEKEQIRHLNDLDQFLRNMMNPFCHHFAIRIHCRHLIKEIYRTVWRMKRGTGYKGEGRLVRKEFFKEAMIMFRWLGACQQEDPELVKKWEVRSKELASHSKPLWKRYRKQRKRPLHRKFPKKMAD